MIREARAAFAAAIAIAWVVGGAIAPACAATDPVLVSRDGATFASAISGGLFDGAGALVPGQSVTRNLWIRNPSASPAAVRVSIRNLVSTSTVFADGVRLTTIDSLPGSTSRTEKLSALGKCEVVSSAPSIAAGGTMKLTLTFAMADLTPALAQGDHAALDLMVAMRDAAAGAFTGSACGDNGSVLANTGDSGDLAFTGELIPVPLIVGGGLFLGIGMSLLLASRRRQSEGD